ncbi:MAG: type II toxin-antitoxin system HicA family toxin [Elusimicrobia bacterium]|nr:type II toxin-antitoxin system HicA family toxin [Elusimicrobiota bacterium]
MRPEKLLDKARRNPAGLRFSELCKLAEAFGFALQRQKGSHRIFTLDRLREIMNFQDDSGKAKAYQVRQLLGCADRNQLSIGGGKND